MTETASLPRPVGRPRNVSGPVLRLDQQGAWVVDYPSIEAAASAVGVKASHLRQAIKRGRLFKQSYWDWR